MCVCYDKEALLSPVEPTAIAAFLTPFFCL